MPDRWTADALKEHQDTVNRSSLILGASVVVAFAAVIFILDNKNGKAQSLALEGQKEATKVALQAANDKGVAHNGLIDRMREMSATFVTRGTVALAMTTTISAAGLIWAIWG